MIEINLLPSAKKKREKRAPRPGLNLKLPSGLADFDRMMLFMVAAWIVGPLLVIWMFVTVQAKKADVEVALEQAVADSARYAAVIQTQQSLRARQDTIAQKLAMIQEIDAGRYVWPHIMEEISMALPPYTWITSISQIQGGALPQFQIEGQTGSLPALTRFMDALEESPFLRNIELISSEQVSVNADRSRVANNFVLVGSFEQPPMDAIETVPLFEDTTTAGASTARSEASNGDTGTS